jgi:type II secretory pathway pseudopilin PulG
MLSKINKKSWGFTLVELLVIIAISAILFSISMVAVSEIRQNIRDNKRRADLHQLARALELFKADHGQYPPNNYYSDQEYAGGDWSADADETMMPILTEGGTLDLVRRTVAGFALDTNVKTQAGYLGQYIKDPINDHNSWTSGNDSDNIQHHHVYIYWGPSYYVFDTTDWPMTWPLDCPDPPPDSCGDPADSSDDNWAACCNGAGCWSAYCEFNNPNLTWYFNYSGFSQWCYGEDSNRVLTLLAADLENESKASERINEVFDFCPTKESDEDLFNNFKRYFYRGKDCYEGPGDAACPDNLFTGWSSYGAGRHNYFIPLTGEFNLN